MISDVFLWNRAAIVLFVGSLIALTSSLFAAFVPSLAYLIVSAKWSDFLLPNAPHYITSPAFVLSIHEFTLKLLVTAFGGFFGVLSIFERKKSVPFLSFTGIALGTIGFLLPTEVNQTFTDIYSVDIPWAGTFIALIGVLLMFLGFALKNPKVPHRAIVSVPLLLVVYSIPPFLILTGNLPLFIFLQSNITLSTILGILILAGHLSIIWAGIIGLRFPEKEDL
jgi:hypothetical protein